MLPPDPASADPDRFYGYVFQDSDFSKWVEAAAYAIAQRPDPELEARADELIDLVCAAQQPNGYLDTYYILNGLDGAFSNLRDHHELYCFGHLAEGLRPLRGEPGRGLEIVDAVAGSRPGHLVVKGPPLIGQHRPPHQVPRSPSGRCRPAWTCCCVPCAWTRLLTPSSRRWGAGSRPGHLVVKGPPLIGQHRPPHQVHFRGPEGVLHPQGLQLQYLALLSG